MSILGPHTFTAGLFWIRYLITESISKISLGLIINGNLNFHDMLKLPQTAYKVQCMCCYFITPTQPIKKAGTYTSYCTCNYPEALHTGMKYTLHYCL